MQRCRANQENTNQTDTNGCEVTPSTDTSTGEDVKVEANTAPEYIKTPEEAQNFIMKLLNHIIDFIVRFVQEMKGDTL